MNCDVQKVHLWDGFKRAIAKFVDRCVNFQEVKAKHQISGGLTQVINEPTRKWEVLNMDFIVGLPQTS